MEEEDNGGPHATLIYRERLLDNGDNVQSRHDCDQGVT
jgi:hypothetical protein